MLIKGHVEVPEITQRQVCNALIKLKRTATGPDNIPFWIWKDQAELLTPVINQVWIFIVINSLMAGFLEERANINSLPKVDFPKADSDYRGINVTPVIASPLRKSYIIRI